MQLRLSAIVIFLLAFIYQAGLAQHEKNSFRIGGVFQLDSFQYGTNFDLETGIGYFLTDLLEIGTVIGVTRNEDIDTFGRVGLSAIFHTDPGSRICRGIGTTLSRTFGYPEILTLDGNSLIWDLFFNLDAFISPGWAFNLRAGYQRWNGDWGDSGGFVTRIGIFTFLRPHRE